MVENRSADVSDDTDSQADRHHPNQSSFNRVDKPRETLDARDSKSVSDCFICGKACSGFESCDFVLCEKKDCRVTASRLFTSDMKQKDEQIAVLHKLLAEADEQIANLESAKMEQPAHDLQFEPEKIKSSKSWDDVPELDKP